VKDEYKQLYFNATTHFQMQILKFKKLNLDTTNSDLNPEDCVDLIYVLREAKELYKGLEKELNKLSTKLQGVACLHCVREEQSKISTEYCTGISNVELIPKIPAKRYYDPELFDKVMNRLNIPEELIESEVVRPNWPALKDYAKEQTAQGKDWPGMEETNAIFKMQVRKKREILD